MQAAQSATAPPASKNTYELPQAVRSQEQKRLEELQRYVYLKGLL